MAAEVRLPDIKASVKVDSKDVDAGLNRVQSSTTKAGKGFEGLQKSATGAVTSLSSSLTSQLGPASGAAESALAKLGATGSLMGPAIAGGAALAGVAVAKFAFDGAQAFVGLAGEIRNFQRASGASAEESSRFVAALDDLGVSSEAGASAIFKLGKSLKDGGTNLKAFGIEVARNKDGTTDLTGTMLNVADAYAKTSDPAKRAELAFAAFGKQGQALIPVLEQGRAGLDAFFKGAESGRQIFSQADLDKARQYELAVDELQDTFRGLKLEAGESLLPYLTSLATGAAKTLEFGNKIKDSLGGAFSGIKDSVAGSAGGPLAQLAGLLGNIGGKSDGAKKSTKEMAEEFKRSAEASQADAEAKARQAAALDKLVTSTLSAVSSQLGYEASVNRLKDNINDLDDRTKEYTDAVNTNGAASKEAEAANRTLRDAQLGIKESAVAAANAAVRLAEDNLAAGAAALTAEEKHGIFKQELIRLAAQADGPSKDAILGLAGSIQELPTETTVSVNADTSAAHLSLNSLESRLNYLAAKGVSVENDINRGTAGDPDAREHGGPVLAGRPYIVGERRPELFVPATNGYIVPRVPTSAAGAATTGSAAPPIVQTVIQIDKKAFATIVSQGQYENRRR